MTILTISIAWLLALGVLVFLLVRRPERSSVSYERSPRLLKDARGDFEAAIGEILASKAAAAQDVRDGSHEDLYVRP
jgi:hypothetical protein